MEKAKKKILSISAGTLMLVGFLIVVGAIGNDDYYTINLGLNYPLLNTLQKAAFGFLVMLLGFFLSKRIKN